MRRLRSIWRASAGTAAIEFAVLAPSLLAMSFGVYEFGRWAWTLEALQESATSGARCVGIGQSACESSGAYSSGSTVSYVQGVAQSWGITVPSADITSNNSTSCGGVTGFSQVSISYVFTSVVAKIIPAGSSGTTLTVNSCYPNSSIG